MEKLKKIISGKNRWEGLRSYISLIEEQRVSEPNAALDGAKSIIETISKTILEDKKISYNPNGSIGALVKQAFEQLPIFVVLGQIEQEQTKAILNGFASITNAIGTFRNNHGSFAHGRDLESQKFDAYLLDLSIASSNLLSSFLILCHSEDLKDRSRIYYEEHGAFNTWFDSVEDWVEIRGVPYSPSYSLFHSDIESYKNAWIEFQNDPDAIIGLLENEDIDKEEVIDNIIDIKGILSSGQLETIAATIREQGSLNMELISKLNDSGIIEAISKINEPMRQITESIAKIYEPHRKAMEAITKSISINTDATSGAIEAIKTLGKMPKITKSNISNLHSE